MKNLSRVLPIVVLIPFTAYTVWVAVTHGFLGMFGVAGREPWALQMLLDLFICYVLVVAWMVPDARARRIPAGPYVVLTLCLGSIGLLVYLVHRSFRPHLATAPGVAARGTP